MPSIVTRLGSAAPTLIFSLPRNDPALAEAALAGGAEALKTHIHIKHQASGTGFGSLAEEGAALRRIREIAADAPMGVVVGDQHAMATLDELEELTDMGVDFFDVYAHHMPAWMLGFSEMERMGALGESYTPVDYRALSQLFECMEAAILPHSAYGRPMTAYHVAKYLEIAQRVEVPVVVPTQLAIRPDEVAALAEVGMSGIMIGAIVTGKEPEGVRRACEAFRHACDECLVKGVR